MVVHVCNPNTLEAETGFIVQFWKLEANFEFGDQVSMTGFQGNPCLEKQKQTNKKDKILGS